MQVISERVKTDKQGKLLLDLKTKLPETEVECVVVIQPVSRESEDELSEEDYQMLEERWGNYLKDPKRGKSWKEVKTAIIKKHGL